MGLYATAGAAAPISALASAMLYVGTSKPAMGALPEESLKDKVLRDIDFSAPSASSQLLEQMSQDAVMKAGGGMMNMNEMIRPIGYDIGGIVPKEKPSPDIKPKEKPVNFNAIMAEFDTPEAKAGQREPTGIEKIIADVFPVDPRSTMEDKIKAMLGMGGGGGSILDDAMDIKTLGMIAELQGVLSFDEIDKMKNMSPIEIEILYNKTFGEEK
jgi:hypothetical protein